MTKHYLIAMAVFTGISNIYPAEYPKEERKTKSRLELIREEDYIRALQFLTNESKKENIFHVFLKNYEKFGPALIKALQELTLQNDYLDEGVRSAIKAGNVDMIRDKLFSAVRNVAKENDISKVQKLVAGGVSPNHVEEYNAEAYPIYSAVENGNLEMAKLLINAGSEVDLVSRRQKTLLMIAAEMGNADMVKLLLNASADVTKLAGFHYDKRSILESAYFSALKGGNPEVIELIKRAGFKYIGENKNLVQAIKERSTKQGNNIIIVGLYMYTLVGADALQALYEIVKGNTSLDQDLMNGIINKNPQEMFQAMQRLDKAFQSALNNRDFDKAADLLAAGAYVDSSSGSFNTPLEIAIRSQDVEMVKFLLKYKPSFKDVTGESILIVAEEIGNQEIIYLLIDAGATK